MKYVEISHHCFNLFSVMGHALLPGEEAAMAAYVSEGKRFPRRGETTGSKFYLVWPNFFPIRTHENTLYITE